MILDGLNLCSIRRYDIKDGVKTIVKKTLLCYAQIIVLILIGIAVTLLTGITWSPDTKWWIVPFTCTILFICFLFYKVQRKPKLQQGDSKKLTMKPKKAAIIESYSSSDSESGDILMAGHI